MFVMTIYEQIQKSIDFIEENLFEKLTLDKVSNSCFMSSRNLYNYFWTITGHSYKEYVIKRRLSEASIRLSCSNENIINIALYIGYESHEAFTRAFKKEFNITPIQFRKSRPNLKGLDKIKLFKEIHMGVIVKKLPGMKAVFFEGYAPEPENKATAKMEEWLIKKQLKKGTYRTFGHNIDMSGNLASDPKNVGYKILVTINDETNIKDDNIKTDFIEPGKFVVTGIEGNFESDPEGKWISAGWEKLNQMVKQKGYKVKCPARWFEEVLEPSVPENLRLDLYIEIE